MSESYAVVIPADPHAPLPGTSEALRTELEQIVGSNRSRFKDCGKLQFIDCGGNFESIACPACAVRISSDIWKIWMGEDWHGEEGFDLQRHATLCCDTQVTLNELVYHWPQGFARWFVSAYDASHGPLTKAELRDLEAVAGISLKAIYQRY